MKKQITKLLFTALMLLIAKSITANNIQVSNVSLTSENIAEDYVMVQFDLSWENSWRITTGPANWDAAWLFIKYRITAANGGDDLWKHAWLHNTGHSGGAGTPATIDVGLLDPGSPFDPTTNPALGAFVFRSGPGSGTFTATGMQLRWNYGENDVADNNLLEIRVFAIEMVYVPQGAFYVGSGGSETAAFYKYPNTTNPFQVISENAITVGTETDNLYYSSTTYGGDQGGPIPDAFPKGYASFYCQKYEITQQQYVDFLNTLTRTQQDSRTYTSLAAGTTSVIYRYVMMNADILYQRSGIRCNGTIHTSDPITFYCDLNGDGTGGQAADGQWIACNQLSWMDCAAYADWAGLRPMTELEFEKACRGTVTPVSNEYAWGTATVADNAYTLSNSGADNEGINDNYSTAPNTGNASYGINIDGPLRVGVFAANTSNTGRITAGAGYYGIMELSGNLGERPVTIGNLAGRSYTGLHGNGNLNTSGDADVSFWPGINGNSNTGVANTAYGGTTGVTRAAGSGFRGGNYVINAAAMRTSDRYNAAYTFIERRSNYGFRAVRDVP
jgi:formylglycine-generating enzyme required for sulfatase activity